MAAAFWAPSPGSTALGQLLALTRSKLSPKQLFATLGVYAFVSAAIGLLVVLVTTRIPCGPPAVRLRGPLSPWLAMLSASPRA